MLGSASLFHFTNSLEALLRILREGFRPHYSLEDFEALGTPDSLGIPMVSFCHTDLSEVPKHTNTYGKYGVALRQEWGIEQKISPVHYIQPESIAAAALEGIYTSLPNRKALQQRDCLELHPQTAAFLYAKPYRGISPKTDDEVLFYEENEWRYIPFAGKTVMAKTEVPLDVKPILSRDDFSNRVEMAVSNEILQESYRLNFETRDINYIIVETENEIPGAIDEIFKVPNCTERAQKKLTTRLISMQQIQGGF